MVRQGPGPGGRFKSKEDIRLLQVDKDKVLKDRSEWVDKFMSYMGEDENE